MSKLSLPLILASALLVGCADTDADGLTNGKEKKLGTDPELADSDEDGISDFDEVETHGTDPLLADSDEDTYLDGWEIIEETDPLDPKSRIYKGYWPYNPDKADMNDPGAKSAVRASDRIYNHTAVDQFGNEVQLYDFLGQGKDIILDASAVWCGPCRVTAEWLSTGGAVDPYNYNSTYGPLLDAIESGDVYWVTILVENQSGGPTVKSDVKEWDSEFPHENVPVIADPDKVMFDAIIQTTGFFPSGVLLNPNGKVLYIGGMGDAMREAQNRL